jgi:hypothetical protein
MIDTRRQRSAIVEWLTLVATVLTLVVAGVTLFVTVLLWAADKEEKWHEAQPNLAYVHDSARFDEGDTVLTFENESAVAPAAITAIHFEITDADMLARIERKHPRPHEPETTSINSADDIVFTEGEWCGGQCYSFSLRASNHVPPSSVNNIRLAIVNPKWAGQTFVGMLIVEYSGYNSPLELSPVTIRCRR